MLLIYQANQQGLGKAFDPALAHYVENMTSNEASSPIDTPAIIIPAAAAKFTPTSVAAPNSDSGEVESAGGGGEGGRGGE